jgi:hypothetical protein
MIPDEALTVIPLPRPYLYPDNLYVTRTLDYELAGAALNDPSEGLEVQVWTLRLEIDEGTELGTFYLSAPTVTEFVPFSGIGITEGSIAFDQNMNPFIGYLQNGVAKYWWFDTVIAQQVHSELPAGSSSPRACLDDKRRLQTSASDVIMCYTRSGNLYFRAQRDRYTVEYLLYEGVTGQVINVGMNDKLRLQIIVGVFE